MSEWISVKDGLPEDGHYLVYDREFGVRDAMLTRIQFPPPGGLVASWGVSDGDGGESLAYVTHWMPLPSAPIVEEKGATA